METGETETTTINESAKLEPQIPQIGGKLGPDKTVVLLSILLLDLESISNKVKLAAFRGLSE